MSRAALSVFVFGLYLVALGVVLLIVPNLLLPAAGLPLTGEVWIRLVGMLLLILSFYYIQAAQAEFNPFFFWTIYTRLGAFFVLLAFVVSGWVGPVVFLFWLGDLAGAIWTMLALRADKARAAGISPAA